MAKAIAPISKNGGRRSAVRDQLLSDHRKTVRQAARPPIVHAVSTKNMCQCSQLPAGSKAAIFDGSSTDRKPCAIHLTGKMEPEGQHPRRQHDQRHVGARHELQADRRTVGDDGGRDRVAGQIADEDAQAASN